ncbi:SulP family inorganic anion transporter [Rummeliibacillus sp. NPDC094406]|uniref:SulP family inorganic anion transporter n=1 Tax=Rummeliibacillus sp. NPDC094406 TaxID=3364511 RepID=UPI0037FF5EB8
MLKKLNFSGRYVDYSLKSFQKDLLSGLIVAVIAIPLGMGFAIASGVKPEYGIYTTIIAGILVSLLGGSKFQIGGPTGAFIPILFGIVISYGYKDLLIAGFLAGILLILMGVFKLGSLIKYIPRPVTIGFTTGIAVTIFVGQIANFLGLENVKSKELFIDNLKEIAVHLYTVNIYSILTGCICLFLILFIPKLAPKVPGPLIGIVVSTIIATIFYPTEVATIGSKYGDIPNSLPQFQFPDITWEKIVHLLKPAFVIAILGSIESLLSAVVADGMTNSKHNSNRELIGQGVANMVTPLFGGIPATGAIARTATNIKTGAVSPISGIVHGLVVLIILILFAPYASNIPLASMAPVLMVVAWNMSEKKVFYHVLKTKTGDSLVLAVTFILTVFINLTVAVEFGLLLAVILFIKNMSYHMVTKKAIPNRSRKHAKVEAQKATSQHGCPQISIFNIEGPLFFGAAQSFAEDIMNSINYKPKVLLLRMNKVPFIDTTGNYYLTSIVKDFSKHGIILVTGLKAEPKMFFKKTGLYNLIGEEHFFDHTGEAIDYALLQLDKNKCMGCKKFVFNECKVLSCEEDNQKRKLRLRVEDSYHYK